MITVQTTIGASLVDVWERFTNPDHVIYWNHASDDWHCPQAQSELKEGGNFNYTMASKDNSHQFDFEGTYQVIDFEKEIVYQMKDGRKVSVKFEVEDDAIIIEESFEPENTHPLELQLQGWQNILDNFKRYCENKN